MARQFVYGTHDQLSMDSFSHLYQTQHDRRHTLRLLISNKQLLLSLFDNCVKIAEHCSHMPDKKDAVRTMRKEALKDIQSLKNPVLKNLLVGYFDAHLGPTLEKVVTANQKG